MEKNSTYNRALYAGGVYNMMKILVTGGAGFIGSHIVDQCIMKGYDVVVVDNLSTGNKNNINSKAKFYEEDIRSENLKEIFKIEDPDVVIHHAAQIDIQKSLREPNYDADVNINGTINLLESAAESKVKKIIYASSAAVYGEPQYVPIDENHSISPLSYYGISKFTPESYIKVYSQLHGLKYTILRYANVYGIRQDPKGEGGVVSIFVDRMLDGIPVTIFGDGEQTRDYVYVEDIARGNIQAIEKADNEIINLGTGKATSVNQLYTTMEEIIATGGEPNYSDARNGDILHSYFNVKKAKDLLDWQALYGLQEGLNKTISYYSQKKKTAEESIAI